MLGPIKGEQLSYPVIIRGVRNEKDLREHYLDLSYPWLQGT